MGALVPPASPPPPPSTCTAFPNRTSLGVPLFFISTRCQVLVLVALSVLLSFAGCGLLGSVWGRMCPVVPRGCCCVWGRGQLALTPQSPCWVVLLD